MDLPSEPQREDGLPRMCPLDTDTGADLQFGVRVPGSGQVVGTFLNEDLAREFIAFFAPSYVERAHKLFADAEPLGNQGPEPTHIRRRANGSGVGPRRQGSVPRA